MMENVILLAVLLLILGGASVYIIKARKTGQKCIGCPSGCSCSGNRGKNISCHGTEIQTAAQKKTDSH